MSIHIHPRAAQALNARIRASLARANALPACDARALRHAIMTLSRAMARGDLFAAMEAAKAIDEGCGAMPHQQAA